MMTLDQLYADVMSLTQRIPDANTRNDYQQTAMEAYRNQEVAKLRQYKAMFSRLQPPPTQSPQKPRQKVVLKPNEEASGMPNPRVYNYFSNFNSPLNPPPRRIQKPYPLYANFGAYNKQNI